MVAAAYSRPEFHVVRWWKEEISGCYVSSQVCKGRLALDRILSKRSCFYFFSHCKKFQDIHVTTKEVN